MRPLTDEECKTFFEKLSVYIGRNITALLERDDEPYCFRLQNDRVYYVSEAILKKAMSFGRDGIASVGTCFGKFSRGGKVRLHITAPDYL
ncbi:Pre-PUA domain-containing protein, partial [Caulochytrium protostelioides]